MDVILRYLEGLFLCKRFYALLKDFNLSWSFLSTSQGNKPIRSAMLIEKGQSAYLREIHRCACFLEGLNALDWRQIESYRKSGLAVYRAKSGTLWDGPVGTVNLRKRTSFTDDTTRVHFYRLLGCIERRVQLLNFLGTRIERMTGQIVNTTRHWNSHREIYTWEAVLSQLNQSGKVARWNRNGDSLLSV